MNSGTFILHDNKMHLEAWIKQNSALQGLEIVGSDLVWNHNGIADRIHVENFYFPTLLYNETFQKDIQDPELINAEDLFRIIEVHVLAQDYNEGTEKKKESVITDFQLLKEQDGSSFITFKDSEGKQYKLKNDLNEAFQIYHNLKAKHGKVKFDDFKKELGQINHESK